MRSDHLNAAACALLISAALAYAQPKSALISDFEAESSANPPPLGMGWYFYDDVSAGGNSKVTTATNMLDTSFTPPKSDYFFDSTTYTAGANGSGQSLKFGFTLGTVRPSCGGTCTYAPGLGMGINIPLELSGATGISFWAKADAPTKVVFHVATLGVKDNGHHAKLLSLTTSWTKYTVTLAELAQPSWAAKVAFNQAEFTGLGWGVSKQDNSAMGAGAVYLDHVVIEGWAPPVEPIAILSAARSGAGMRWSRTASGLQIRLGADARPGSVSAVDGKGRSLGRVGFPAGARSAFLPLPRGVEAYPVLSRP